jgi:GTP-binding protein HflX
LKHDQLKLIHALLNAHIGNVDIVGLQLARRLAQAAHFAHRMVGVLLDRKGEVRFVIVGDATRLYLPDIGRLRGGKDKLRALRLIVARPSPFVRQPDNSQLISLSQDFRTDLEKLRLDAVIEIDASREGQDGALVIGHLARNFGAALQSRVITSERVFRSVHDISETFPHFIESILSDLGSLEEEAKKKPKAFSDKAILVGVYSGPKKLGLRSMAELKELARSAKVEVIDSVYQWRARFNPKMVIGVGKLEEICLHALSLGVEMLIFDQDLSPSQLKNITDLTDLKVLDRSMLILDIFAQRAVTREGKLQVEMAQLNYSLPRLADRQSGMSRLTGGIGGRGPGETRLEIDRRRVKDRLARLERELDDIKRQRHLRRQVRSKNRIPTLAIVGYTNAGKSTLLNALSNSDIYAKDELFATLDPHSRRLRFPNEVDVVVTDTVGFINNLPKSLMQAFMATLEELNDADILLHVIDIADDNYAHHIKVVESVLSDLEISDKKCIIIANKIDKLSHEELSERRKIPHAIFVSAEKRLGLNELVKACSQAIRRTGDSQKTKQFKTNEDAEDFYCDERPEKELLDKIGTSHKK